MDIGIINGRVYRNGEFHTENLYIKNETIDTITKSYLPCEKEINVAGKLVLPGFIDPHVHFHLTVGENTSKDDFYSGSVEGALGGITTYIDFLDPIRTSNQLEEAFKERMELAKRSIIDYSFHTTIANPTDAAKVIMEESVNLGLPSIKLFTTYSNTDRRTYDNYIDSLLALSKELKCRVVIHAENDTMIDNSMNILVKDHETSRPVLSERTEIIKLAEMARERDGLLYIVHVSAGSSVELLHKQYAKELQSKNILLESCPHYFVFNKDRYKTEEGYRYTMTPPLRSEQERKKIHKHIDDITVIGTDHCPFDENLKRKGIYTSKIPMGVGGIKHSFSTMYTEFGADIIPKFTDGPAKAYGLYPRKGSLNPGSDADIVIYDDSLLHVIDDNTSIYHGRYVKGQVVDVFLRGKQIVHSGACIGGEGRFLKRELEL